MAPISQLMAGVRLNRLLSRGYFPAELPRPFTSERFGARAHIFRGKWDTTQIDYHKTIPEDYGIPRFGQARRKLSLVNPVNQLRVAELISYNWNDIRKRLLRSSISEFTPRIAMVGSRAVTGINFEGVARRRAEILAQYGRLVRTDVARFYGSIYTHAITWALLGKEYYKANYKAPAVKSSYASLLDRAVAAGQQGHTTGIPIGPDTSRIISELVATEIEQIVSSLIGGMKRRAVRYVDDILIGVAESESPAAILGAFSAALYEYGLEVSAEKTMSEGLGAPHPPEWLHFVRSFELSTSPSRQREQLDSFFEQAIYLADANPKDGVLLYAVKRASSFDMHENNIGHLTHWLVYASRRAPMCTSFVAEQLAALSYTKSLPKELLEAYILERIPILARALHVDELAWLLFLARELKMVVPAEVLRDVFKMKSSVVALLVLDLHSLGRIKGKLDQSFWKTFADGEGLRSSMWLLAYEAPKKGWWQKTKYVTSDTYFGDLWAADVWFYDQSRKARTYATPSFDAPSPFSPDIGFGIYPF